MDFYDVGERHYLHKFQEFQNSYALISPLSNVKCAIVFVHGFGGDSHGTWNEFPLMVDDFRPCASYYLDCDLFFFQYYSRSEWINASTSRFLNFIDEVVLKPDSPHFYERSSFVQLNQNIELRSEQRPDISVLSEPRHYEILVLVGHSEGGVVIRNAVLGRFKNSGLFSRFNYTRRLLLSAHLSFFAPAIAGYVPKGLLGVLSNCPGLGDIMNAFLSGSAGYQDLRNKQFLQDLRRHTEEGFRAKQHPALRANIAWGYRDGVVHPTKYDFDSEVFMEKGHIDICKPNYDDPAPLEFVIRGLIPPHQTEQDLAHTE